MRKVLAFLSSFGLTAALVVVSYLWLDRPISYFVHNQFAGIRIFVDLTRIPEIFSAAAGAVFVLTGLYVLIRRPWTRLTSVLTLCVISIAVSTLIKDQLKILFGRTWPETWVGNNPSLIHDGVYGFNFFKKSIAYGAFPSGHTTVACAVAAVLWIGFPSYRPLWVVMVLLVAIGLIGANYHFLGDVIAGAFVGASSGWMTVLLWDARLPPIGAKSDQISH